MHSYCLFALLGAGYGVGAADFAADALAEDNRIPVGPYNPTSSSSASVTNRP